MFRAACDHLIKSIKTRITLKAEQREYRFKKIIINGYLIYTYELPLFTFFSINNQLIKRSRTIICPMAKCEHDIIYIYLKVHLHTQFAEIVVIEQQQV